MEECGHILIRYYLNVLKCPLTFWENSYKKVDLVKKLNLLFSFYFNLVHICVKIQMKYKYRLLLNNEIHEIDIIDLFL